MTVLTQELKQEWQGWAEEAGVCFNSELVCGLTAQEWMDAGICPTDRENCLSVGAFDPSACAELLNAEVDIEKASRNPTDAEIEKYNLPYGGYSLAYMHSNGDITVETLQGMIS